MEDRRRNNSRRIQKIGKGLFKNIDFNDRSTTKKAPEGDKGTVANLGLSDSDTQILLVQLTPGTSRISTTPEAFSDAPTRSPSPGIERIHTYVYSARLNWVSPRRWLGYCNTLETLGNLKPPSEGRICPIAPPIEIFTPFRRLYQYGQRSGRPADWQGTQKCI